MKLFSWAALIGLVVVAVCSVHAVAGTSGAVYDMSRFLVEPHPFSQQRTAPRLRPISSPIFRTKRTTPFALETAVESNSPPPVPQRTSMTETLKKNTNGDDLLFSEFRVGGLFHDQGPFSSNKEGGFDGNLELLFTSPALFDVIWSPRPHIGATINSSDDTSKAYLGLTWDWDFFNKSLFFNFTIGGAVHDGETATDQLDKKELGCRALFRESIDIGYRFNVTHSLMLHFDHTSNAKLCSTNEGLETLGIRYGYSF